MEERDPQELLQGLVADFRTWLSVQDRAFARMPQGAYPEAPNDLQVDSDLPTYPTDPASDAPVETLAEAPAKSPLDLLRAELDGCTRCSLHEGRTHLVFGTGSETADIVFVGEGPGRNEDQQGEPFVGAAGALLTRIVNNVLRLERSEVYICNVVKCRPPRNRDPRPDEVATCSPFLWRQLEAIQPKIVVGLGRFAIQCLLETQQSVGRLRGRAHPFRGAVLIPTYHPAYLLRNPSDKRKVFEDMMLVRSEYARITGTELPSPLKQGEARS